MDSRIVKIIVKGDSMWPTWPDGSILDCVGFNQQTLKKSDIIVFSHPLKPDTICVKRIKEMRSGGIFVQGDNPDPLASEDSHNFGLIQSSAITAIYES
ncbi:MAG: S24 family peptidase [Candidatus Poseidoniales archaeon]|jgi:nickel-type superoxide dismutase maturation protease